MQIQNKLTGIERELVLQYLIDGNVPVTLTPFDENLDKDSEVIHSLTSQIFPIAIKGEDVKVNKDGTILLENPPQAVVNFANKVVKCEFYFHKVGLYFISDVTETKDGLALVLPKEIERIIDEADDKKYNFSALMYFDCKTRKDLNISCVPYAYLELFSRPVLKIIPIENQKKAKELLEDFVKAAKVEKNAGNGIQLIPICKYLTEAKTDAVEAMEGRIRPLSILFVDHERLVLGMDSKLCTFFLNDEFGFKLSFSLNNGPVLSRDIFVTATVNKLYRSKDNNLSCVDFTYTSIQEEDLRFIYEKATKTLFI